MKDTDQDKSRSARRPKEQMTAWERWELPLLDEQGNEVEEKDVRPVTAGELEDIRKAAHDDGHADGRKAGYQEGFEQGRKDGHTEGHATGEAEGREQGRQQALEQTRQQVSASMDRLEHLLGELVLPIKRHEEEIETVLVNLTTALARSVVYRELSLDSSQIRQVVRQALSILPSTATNLRIHIHPDDIEPVREVAERLETEPRLIEDESLMPGGCRVESGHSLVDYTVEKRFQRAVQGMLEEQLGDGAESDTADTDLAMGELTDFHRDVLSGSAMEPDSTGPQASEDDNDLPSG